MDCVILFDPNNPNLIWECDCCYKKYKLTKGDPYYKDEDNQYYFMYTQYNLYSEQLEPFIRICRPCGHKVYNNSETIKMIYDLNQRRIKNENPSC
jgi:hypothetical protein